MNLKFKTRQVFLLESQIALEKMQIALELNNYKIVKTIESTILFNNEIDQWRIVSNFGYYSKINNGEIEIIENNNKSIIDFTYYLDINFELVELAILSGICFLVTPYALILMAAICINFALKAMNIKHNLLGRLLEKKSINGADLQVNELPDKHII